LEQTIDPRIRSGTLQRLRTAYQAAAAARDFPGLSRFEQWARLRAQAAQTSIDYTQLEVLDTLEVMRKSQVLDWLERSAAIDQTTRFKSA
jgi:hypothetical protein